MGVYEQWTSDIPRDWYDDWFAYGYGYTIQEHLERRRKFLPKNLNFVTCNDAGEKYDTQEFYKNMYYGKFPGDESLTVEVFEDNIYVCDVYLRNNFIIVNSPLTDFNHNEDYLNTKRWRDLKGTPLEEWIGEPFELEGANDWWSVPYNLEEMRKQGVLQDILDFHIKCWKDWIIPIFGSTVLYLSADEILGRRGDKANNWKCDAFHSFDESEDKDDRLTYLLDIPFKDFTIINENTQFGTDAVYKLV